MRIPFQCQDMQNISKMLEYTRIGYILWKIYQKSAIHATILVFTIVHPFKASGQKSAIFPFQSLHFRFLFSFLKKYTILYTQTHTKKRNLVFILSHYSYAELAAFSICANDVFHISVYLAEIYSRVYSKARARDEFPKTHTTTPITTQLDAIKKFAFAILSRRLVNLYYVSIFASFEGIQSEGKNDPINCEQKKS